MTADALISQALALGLACMAARVLATVRGRR
jgi:hypothetical protein